VRVKIRKAMKAVPKRTIAPVGIAKFLGVTYLKIDLNQLSGAPLAGKVALRTLETIDPIPRLIIIVPSVAIKGGSERRLTKTPLKSPNAVEIKRIKMRESHMGHPQVL
jgi:hypothetical protein